jgi:hypothetical protein
MDVVSIYGAGYLLHGKTHMATSSIHTKGHIIDSQSSFYTFVELVVSLVFCLKLHSVYSEYCIVLDGHAAILFWIYLLLIVALNPEYQVFLVRSCVLTSSVHFSPLAM